MKKTSIGIGTLVFIVFLTLKLAEVGMVKYWSWWWVFSPIWIPILLGILLIIFCAVFDITLQPPPEQKPSRFQQRLKEMQEKRKQQGI